MAHRSHFASRMGAVLAVAGSAVGLGNIWRFPCETGQNGGAAFILLYVLCIILIAVPVLIAELAIGRETRANVYDTFRHVAATSPAGIVGRTVWRTAGAMCVTAGFLLFSYYSVVAGWTLEYSLEAGVNNIAGKDAAQFAADFNSFVADPVRPVVWLVVFVWITAAVVIMGVQKGIERWSKLLMPLLFVLLIVLAGCSLSLPGAMEGLRFLFAPDFSKITPGVALEAMEQAFFTLSVGIGSLLTYATYFSDNLNIPKDSFTVAVLDTCVALLAGVIIFPAALTVGVSPDTGPTLVFITLPNVFQQAFGSQPWLCYTVTLMFYLLLAMAALTSSISMLEITTAFVSEKFGMSRRRAAVILSLFTCIAGAACSLSFGLWSDVKVLGMGFFDLFDSFVARFAMPLGGVFLCLIMQRMGRSRVTSMITNRGTLKLGRFADIYYFLITKIIPLLIAVVFINEIAGIL